MARTHSFSNSKERSKIDTPWGMYDVGKANKRLMVEVEGLQERIESAEKVSNLVEVLDLTIELICLCVANGDDLRVKLQAAWDAGEVGADELSGTAEFLSEELFGAAEKND